MSVCIIHCDAFRHGKIICNQADICVRINLKGMEGWKNWLLVCIICVGGSLNLVWVLLAQTEFSGKTVFQNQNPFWSHVE